MRRQVKVGVAIALPALVLGALGTTLWLNRPFQVELASYHTSLVDRTEAQRHNIRQAAMALDGVVIEPGETFSFNETVGPRTPERGFREAPAFMERDLVTSIGGGICQVSSTLYNAVALAGLSIVERHAHSHRVASVPPGRDATVWYGMNDLKFMNSQKLPIQLSIRTTNDKLKIGINGHSQPESLISIRTKSVKYPSGIYSVQTDRVITMNMQLYFELLSIDVYY